jgi:hypothetical protein
MHLFAVGQTVRLKRGFGTSSNLGDIYRITSTLPPVGRSLQYRIRNDDERYERVVTEDNLEQVRLPAPGDGTALIERTFGHGQGTETQQPRDQKTEAGEGIAQG